MPADYHLHLEEDACSGPCRYTPERISAYFVTAQRRGLAEIGISEHCHRFVEFADIMASLHKPHPGPGGFWLPQQFNHNLDAYVEAVLAARRRGMRVRLGIEVDYVPGREADIKAALAGYPWDYVIGSVHFLDRWGIDVGEQYGWPDADVDAVYRRYFEQLRAAAGSGLFDIMAHPDLVKKFGHRPSFDLSGEYAATTAVFKAAGVAAELSTAGWRRPVAEAYPSAAWLQMLAVSQVPIVLGSDAHRPGLVGFQFRRAARLAQSCGYQRTLLFRSRRGRAVSLRGLAAL